MHLAFNRYIYISLQDTRYKLSDVYENSEDRVYESIQNNLIHWSIRFEDETKVYISHLNIILQGISTNIIRKYTFSEI